MSGPLPLDGPPQPTAESVGARWVATLDALEADLAAAAAEVTRLAAPAAAGAAGPQDAAAEAPPPAPPALPAPPAPRALPPLPALHTLPASAAAEIAARADALLRRQADLIGELRAALSQVRRHLDLLDTMATPPARPRYVDQLS